MTTSMNINNYEPWWKSNVFGNPGKTYMIQCTSKKEAYAIRLKGYGFIRALRMWLADPTVPDEAKTSWVGCIGNAEVKEMVIRQEGGVWVLVIRPRTQLTPRLVEVETDMSQVLPVVIAKVQEEKDIAEAEEEYQRRKAAGELDTTQPTRAVESVPHYQDKANALIEDFMNLTKKGQK